MNDDSIAHYYGSCYDYYLGIMDSSEMACSFLKWLLNNDKDANNNNRFLLWGTYNYFIGDIP